MRFNAITPLLSALSVSLLLAQSPVVLASSCSDLSESDCGTSENCTWVNGYERSDGRVVRSYCRTRPATKGSSDKADLNIEKPVQG